MKEFSELIGVIVIFTITIVGLSFLTALPTMWLWDYLMPTLFGLSTITFWQALALNLLCGVLFKSSTTSKNNI
jgi:uncharacterized membrane protein YkgB